MRFHATRTFGWLLLLANVLLCLLVGYFIHISPIAFQKSLSLEPLARAGISPLQLDAEVPDVRSLLQDIPYDPSPNIFFDVEPRQRYERAIHEGLGNCANLVMGLAYLLRERGYTYQVVHLMPYDGFLKGRGHTVLNMPYRLDGAVHTGIVDIFEGGLPRFGEQFVDLQRLRDKHMENVHIMPLNARKDSDSEYYGNFLDEAAVGIVSSQQIHDYYDFLQAVYVPLGSRKLERNLFVGVALVLGKFPYTYVDADEYRKLFTGNEWTRAAAYVLLWILRGMPLLGVLFLVALGVERLSRRRPLADLPLAGTAASCARLRGPFDPIS